MAGNKGNEYAIDTLKQLITLASAILTLTITFLKDALGTSASAAGLAWLVPVSWFFLLLTIWWGWLAVAEAADTIGASARQTRYVFEPQSPPNLLRARAQYTQWFFLIGITCLAIFAGWNFRLIFESGHPPIVTTSTPTVTPTVPSTATSTPQSKIVDTLTPSVPTTTATWTPTIPMPSTRSPSVPVGEFG